MCLLFVVKVEIFNKESLTSFDLPSNHWLNYVIILSINWSECSRAICILYAKCWSNSSSFSSGKLDFRIQPFVVVLSAIDKMCESGGRVPSRRVIHGHISNTANSSIFRVSRHVR